MYNTYIVKSQNIHILKYIITYRFMKNKRKYGIPQPESLRRCNFGVDARVGPRSAETTAPSNGPDTQKEKCL